MFAELKSPGKKLCLTEPIVTSPEAANALEDMTADLAEFKESVVRANIELVKGYADLNIGAEDILLNTLQESKTEENQGLEEYEL